MAPDTHAPRTLDPQQILAERFARAIVEAFPQLASAPGGELVDPFVSPAKGGKGAQDFGDFQCNAAMPLAKRLGMKPRDVAQAIVARADLAGVAEPVSEASIAGPGFINVRLDTGALARLVEGMDAPGAGVTPDAPARTVVVDLMGVNLAKQMHVGHIRSPNIGDALARVLERLGHRVQRQNHVGDWGLNIAMVTARLMREQRAGRLDLATVDLDTLDKAYAAAQAECRRDVEGLAAARRHDLGPKALAELEEQVAGATEAFTRARETLVKLQSGDAETRAVWRRIADVTMSACLATCARMGWRVTGEHSAGESSYAEELAPMIDDLLARGVAVADQGALIVRLDDQHPPANPYGPVKEPCLVRKSDGGFLYATTDIAAVRRRVQRLGASRVVYAIDARQSLHMRQVFCAATKAGYATVPVGASPGAGASASPDAGRPAQLEHAAFGAILGEDGRPYKTRTGENVKLASLIDEMVARAERAVRERTPDLDAVEARRIAEGVGVAALKYADLCIERTKDYVFSFDRMLAFEGNTGPYLLYALVRIRSIFRKAEERGVSVTRLEATPLRVEAPAEKTLALALLRYPGAVRSVADTLEPHRLCQYLYDLAGAFSTFFDACPVLSSDEPVRSARLRLCRVTERVLDDGLGLLGIPTLDRM